VLTRGRIRIDADERENVLADPGRVLRLFDLARDRAAIIASEDLESIRSAVPGYAIAPDLRRSFLDMLARPAGIGLLLRNLHRVGLLGRLIPAFEHTRCLTQFNLMHKYTVDEHSILAVERAAGRSNGRNSLGRAYREIRRKDLLHLALLCHDLGKGLSEDHCEEGRRIAIQTASLFGLHGQHRDLFVFLIHQHLLMAQTAFRRDVGDPATLAQFARAVGTPEALRMLYLITAADTEAVSPGNWTAWKESLLDALYARTMEELAGEAPVSDESDQGVRMRRALADALQTNFAREWLEGQLEALPDSYLRHTERPRIKAHLLLFRGLGAGDVRVDSEYVRETGITRYAVVAHDTVIPGIFSKISGVLAAARFEILGAQIITRPDGFLIDTFEGLDTDFAGEPPITRREAIAGNIRDVLLGRKAVESLFRNRLDPTAAPPVVVRPTPPRVEIDNQSSDRFTIVEVFADDRQGLLYDITRTLFELGLSVYSARISTHVDQVVDAFYVSTQDGRKVDDEAAREVIRARLLAAISR
jgi:[protein-PII] uridylyltransferase